jgi:hypothetical protein
MQSARVADATDESIGPPARKERAPQDDKSVFEALVCGALGCPMSRVFCETWGFVALNSQFPSASK